ncbi:Ubiquinone biosynthesis protein coq9, mitochondrial [Modicella reniformis]|uniref:Ubiquinone biosynthesis protein n=1 Tax=Modicella reniformis TaxID=1440133 RepID=A0A9P6LRL9_9FUNG|nr:Ubiquinone biosynthesis protein coq9, mitochondrial [Modicella reniformis]
MASLLRRTGGTLFSRSPSVLLTRTTIKPATRQFTVSACCRTARADINKTQDTEQPATFRHHATPDTILNKALTLVPQHGWTIESITKAAESMGYPTIIHGMFPNGGADLIDYFLKDCLNRLPLELEGRMEGLGTQEKIRLGTLTRLGMIAPYIDRWPEALAVMGQPSNVPMALNHLAKIVDEIWHLAGDKSADMNWYTKRASLAVIYTTTELYMTTDKTPNYEATQKFLDRRFEDAATLGKATNEVLQIAEFGAKSVFGIITSKGFRL